jgi:DNA-binding NarL/FixJ family response regulator
MPSVWHVSSLPPEFIGRESVTTAMDVVAHELAPLATSFFRVEGSAAIRSSVVHGSHLPTDQLAAAVHGWEEQLDTLDAGTLAGARGALVTLGEVSETVHAAYVHAGVIDDVRLVIREGVEPVAGLSLWRAFPGPSWTGPQLRGLATVQPLVELGYVGNVREVTRIDARLPDTLTGRQRQVARLLAAGATTLEISRSLFVSPNTAKSHIRVVMSKLGVASRRELARRFAVGLGADPPPQPQGPTRHEGDRAPARLLDAVLQWSSDRLSARLGGCVLLSTRLEPIGEAWATTAGQAELRLAWRVHRQVLGSASPPALVRYLDADRAQRRVVQLDLTDFPANETLDDLVESAGLASPLVAVLRAHGRLAGLVWLGRDERGAPDVSESARALRQVHPLIELSDVTRRGGVAGLAVGAGALAELGLTPREVAVARLALAGEGNVAIADAMSISESTVKKHMSSVLAKCGVRSRTQLIALLGDDPEVP